MTRLGNPEALRANCAQAFDTLYRTHGRDVSWVKHPPSTLTDDFIEKLPPRAFIYDLGCGSGDKTFAIAERRPDIRIKGFDISAEAIRLATEQAETLGIADRIQFEQRDILSLDPDRLELADGIHEYQCLTHITRDSQLAVVRLMRAILNDSGTVIVNAFHRGTIDFHGVNISQMGNGEYVFRYNPDNPKHQGKAANDGMYCYFFQPGELEGLFSPFFSNIGLKSVPHPSIRGRLHWEGLFIVKQ